MPDATDEPRAERGDPAGGSGAGADAYSYEAALPWRCAHCGRRDYAWQKKCGHCRARNAMMHAPPGVAVEPPRLHAPPHSGRELELEREAARAPVQPATHAGTPWVHVPTGFARMDAALGGGLARGAVHLLGAERKAGKTTWVLEAMHQCGEGIAAYATAEQSRDQVVAMAQRVGAMREGLYVLEAPELDDALAQFDALRARFVCIDSVNRVRAPGPRAAARGGRAALEAIIERAKAWAVDRDAVLVLISHFTKDGDFVGGSGVQHDVDCGLVMRKHGEGGLRSLTVELSRIGPDDGPPRGWFQRDAAGRLAEVPPPRGRAAARLALVPAGAPGHDSGHRPDGPDDDDEQHPAPRGAPGRGPAGPGRRGPVADPGRGGRARPERGPGPHRPRRA